MTWKDQNEQAAANPVYSARYQQLLELQRRVKALEDEKKATDNG